jgi:hypothetical protein
MCAWDDSVEFWVRVMGKEDGKLEEEADMAWNDAGLLLAEVSMLVNPPKK